MIQYHLSTQQKGGTQFCSVWVIHFFDVHVTMHRVKFLIIKPTRCTNFSNLFSEWNSTCFGQFLCPSSGVFHCTRGNGICHTGLLTACEQAVGKPVWHIPLLCVQWKTHDDGQRNCPKHVEFHSKNKFEKLEHLVGFIIRNLTRCMVTWTSNTLLILVFIYCVHRSLTGITTHQNHSSLYVVASIYAISKMFQIVVVF